MLFAAIITGPAHAQADQLKGVKDAIALLNAEMTTKVVEQSDAKELDKNLKELAENITIVRQLAFQASIKSVTTP